MKPLSVLENGLKLGLNALKIYPIADEVLKKHLPRDRVATTRAEYRERLDPTFITHGPRTGGNS